MVNKKQCWIGCATHGALPYQVSNGPVGHRSESCDFESAAEAIDYARREGMVIVFEDDFRWDAQPATYSFQLRVDIAGPPRLARAALDTAALVLQEHVNEYTDDDGSEVLLFKDLVIENMGRKPCS